MLKVENHCAWLRKKLVERRRWEKKKRVSIEHMKPRVHGCFTITVPISHTNLGGNHFHLSLSLSPILGGLDVVIWLSEVVTKGRPLPLLTFPIWCNN